MRVAIYIRVSTDHKEQSTSLQNQEGGALEAVQRNDWTIYDIYQERQSGLKLHKRKEFIRMMEDARQRKFDIIWVKSLTRFGRKIADLHKYVEELVRLDIRFIAEIEGIDTYNNDWSTKLGMWSMFAQWESQGLSDRIRFALEVKARRGEYTGTLPPYGYDMVGKTLEISKDGSADVIRRIFSMYLNGIGPSRIANVLSDEGVPTPHQRLSLGKCHNEWHESTIRGILTNPVYIGYTVSCKETTKVLGDIKRVPRPESERILKEETHPYLITLSDFKAVQRRMSSRSRKEPFRPHTHLFSNLLYCGDCGSRMYCIVRPWGRVHYVCGRYIKSRRRNCSRHTVYEDELAVLVLKELQKAVQPNLKSPYQKSTDVEQFIALEKQIKKLSQRQSTAQDLYIDGDISKEEYHGVLERTQTQLSEFRKQLNELDKERRQREALSPVERESLLQARVLSSETLIRYVKCVMISVDGKIRSIDFTFF